MFEYVLVRISSNKFRENHVSFEAFTAVLIQVEFWVVTLCSDKVGYQRFRGPCCLHIQSEVRGSIDL